VNPVKNILELKHVSKSFRVMEKRATFDSLKAAPEE
jgi:hypothetical protein